MEVGPHEYYVAHGVAILDIVQDGDIVVRISTYTPIGSTAYCRVYSLRTGKECYITHMHLQKIELSKLAKVLLGVEK